jgi:hypothetical protein
MQSSLSSLSSSSNLITSSTKKLQCQEGHNKIKKLLLFLYIIVKYHINLQLSTQKKYYYYSNDDSMKKEREKHSAFNMDVCKVYVCGLEVKNIERV